MGRCARSPISSHVPHSSGTSYYKIGNTQVLQNLKGMRLLLISVVLMLLASGAHAMRQPPTDADRRATTDDAIAAQRNVYSYEREMAPVPNAKNEWAAMLARFG